MLQRSLAIAALTCAFPLAAADWPQWRGPKRDGISAETGLLQEWPKEGPKLHWMVKGVGGGYSTPAIAGGKVFLIGSRDKDEFCIALDAKNGDKLWEAKLGPVGANKGPQYPGSRSTPTVDGDVLFALGSDGDLLCLGVADGKEKWRKSCKNDFGGEMGLWAFSESPLVDGELLFCAPGGKDATLVALKKATGETVWKSAIGDAAG